MNQREQRRKLSEIEEILSPLQEIKRLFRPVVYLVNATAILP